MGANYNWEGESGVNLNEYAAEVHKANQQWWHDLDTGKRLERNKGEQMMLIVSEIAEATEGTRKGLADDKLPHRTMEEVEMAYNAQRADHTAEHRRGEGGKRF